MRCAARELLTGSVAQDWHMQHNVCYRATPLNSFVSNKRRAQFHSSGWAPVMVFYFTPRGHGPGPEDWLLYMVRQGGGGFSRSWEAASWPPGMSSPAPLLPKTWRAGCRNVQGCRAMRQSIVAAWPPPLPPPVAAHRPSPSPPLRCRVWTSTRTR
jgi:hypothetical protein